MSYPDGYARYIISRSTIHHWADPVQALREIYRVLEPGGIVMIHEPRRDASPAVVSLFNGMRESVGYPAFIPEEKYTPSEVLRMCEEAGIGQESDAIVSDQGVAALGFELRITKSRVAARGSLG